MGEKWDLQRICKGITSDLDLENYNYNNYNKKYTCYIKYVCPNLIVIIVIVIVERFCT